MRKMTIENFKIGKVYSETTGHWSLDQGKFGINYSSILTKLIQEAGRWCEYHASDLFINWNCVMRKLSDHEAVGEKFVFGFRKSGVDGIDRIIDKLNNYYSSEYYRSIWVLDIQVEETDCSWGKNISMQLGRINL